MYIEIRRVYPWATCTAVLTDTEKGWESSDSTFLLAIRTAIRSYNPKHSYSPNKIRDVAVAVAEKLGAEIVRMEFDRTPSTPDTVY